MASDTAKRPPGRPRIQTDFRQRCRDIVLSPKVWKGIAARARRDPEFAMRVAEHGFGRPTQAVSLDQAGPLTVRIEYASGSGGQD